MSPNPTRPAAEEPDTGDTNTTDTTDTVIGAGTSADDRPDPACFDTPAHRAAQAACRHLFHCAVDAATRAAAVANFENARATGDPAAMSIGLRCLTGPCCLPPTWTFVGHWHADLIVVEYALPGVVPDDRIDTGHWPEGLWAAAGSGHDLVAAQAAAVAEYEHDHPKDQDTARDQEKGAVQDGDESS